MSVDRSSSEYMFGQIMARLNEGDRTIQELGSKVDGLTSSVDRLPCSLHTKRLDDVEVWQTKHNSTKVKGSELSLKFKQGLVIALSASALSALQGAIVALLIN